MTDDRTPRFRQRHRIAIIVACAFVSVDVMALVILGAVGGAFDGPVPLTCGFDPTDPCNWSVVVVRNDSSSRVVLRQCAHHCGDGDKQWDPPTEIAAGGRSSGEQSFGIRAFVRDRDWWAVADAATGRQLGCLVLDGHRHKTDGDEVLVSQARRCRSDQATTAPVGRATVQPY